MMNSREVSLGKLVYCCSTISAVRGQMSRNFTLLAAIFVIGGIASAPGCSRPLDASLSDNPSVLTVATLAVESTTVERTTTQPATVHPFYEAKVLAKTSGYLVELHVDIGSRVTAGDLLAKIDVPEMVAQYERHQAALASLRAAVARAEASIVVAQAAQAAAEALSDQAKAGEQSAAAQLKADESEHARVADLVRQRALSEKILDEVLKRLDASRAATTSATATTASANANIDVAKAELLAARADLEAAKADIVVGQKRVEESQTLMRYAELRAPFDGVILERNVELGDLVRNSQTSTATKPLFVIAQLETVRVRVAIPERDAPLANVGDNATITLQALPGKLFEATIARVAGGLAASTRTMLVEIDLPNSDGELLPGMFGQATITLTSATNTTLPAQAVRFDEMGNSYVYVVDNSNTVQVVNVQIGFDDGKRIEITSGLDVGQRVIGPSLRRWKAGEKVLVEG